MKKELRCASCSHWKNEQAELEYSKIYGICTCHKWAFSVTEGEDCVLLDRENITGKHITISRFEYESKVIPIGDTTKSRYCLVTEEGFGCIHYNKKSTQ